LGEGVRLSSPNLWCCPSIAEFLKRPRASLLIRGEPGSGKTLLALRIAEELRNSFYISTRISAKNLFETYPFLREIFDEKDVIDVHGSSIIIDARIRKLASDLRDEKSSRILWMKYEDKPSFLQELVFLLRNKSNSLVIIDSLEAIEEYVERDILKDLLEMSDEFDFKLVLVVERSERGRADYFVDGVVELRREIIDEGVLRRIIIHKLRGIQISQPEYLFTLKDGKFSVFKPFSYEPPKEPRLFEPLEDPDEEHFSSGSRSLDEIFGGGLRKGSTILFEIEKDVTREMYYPFLELFSLNFLRNMRKVYNIPTLGTNREDIVRRIALFVTGTELKNFIFIERGWGRERLRREEAIEEAERTYEIVDRERGGSYEDLHITGVDSVYSRYGDEVIRVFEEGNVFVQDTKGLLIRVTKPGFPFTEELSNLSDVHIKMKNFCGVPVIRGMKPKTQYYAMTLDLSEGFPRVEFEKIE
jgi:KaiC/GvpD/RAD55 family RecA-like ATPase